MGSRSAISESLLFTICLAVFGWLSQHALLPALLFPGIGAIIMARHFTTWETIRSLLGLRLTGLPGILLGSATGLLAVLTYHSLAGGLVWPIHLTQFAWIAAAIGLTEELLFRGFLLSRVQAYGSLFSILFTAIAHTLYKVAIFLSSPQIAIEGVAGWTLAAGLFLGWLRFRYRSVLPAALNHVVFDVLVYGGAEAAFWWVW